MLGGVISQLGDPLCRKNSVLLKSGMLDGVEC